MKISVGASAVASLKKQKNEIIAKPEEWYFTHIWGEKNPRPIWSKFFTEGDIRDRITYAKFGDDRLGEFSVARGHILGFSIGFHRRPYNTLALVCECVI